MARLIIPADFSSQRTLLANIVAKNAALGSESPLTQFLTQQNINLADDVAAGETAQTHETNRSLLSKQSENFSQLRDNAFDAPWSHITGIAQFLKKFYKGNTNELGNWGYPIIESGKIQYPAPFTERVTLFGNVVAKHTALGSSSPLPPYLTQNNINLATDADFVETAATNNTAFINAAQQSENATELRNAAWNPVVEHITAIGDFLKGLFANNPKALGGWGFVVDDSPRKPKLRTTKLKLGAQIINKSVVIGSVLTNIGANDLHLYKGSTTTGTPIILQKGEPFGIQKGWSTITVVNPSTLVEGKFTWLTTG